MAHTRMSSLVYILDGGKVHVGGWVQQAGLAQTRDRQAVKRAVRRAGRQTVARHGLLECWSGEPDSFACCPLPCCAMSKPCCAQTRNPFHGVDVTLSQGNLGGTGV